MATSARMQAVLSARYVTAPPMPSDENVCRWCGSSKRQMVPDLPKRCSRGCLADGSTDVALYPGFCEDCRKPFLTGDSTELHQCWRCRSDEMARDVAAARDEGRPVTGWLKNQRLQNIDSRNRKERSA